MAHCDEEEKERKRPIDHGWAWVITIAVFGCNILCVGYHRAFGVFFVEIIDTYDSSASMTSLIVGIQYAVFCLTALVVHNVLLELVSVRTSALIGGLAMASGMMLGMFANSLAFLIFSLSVLVGMGNAMIYGPGLVLLGQYFDQRRAIAMSLANTGASVGSMALPVLATHLVTHYGLRAALLLYGAVTLHLCVFASLYRPVRLGRWQNSPVTSETEADREDSSVALLPGESKHSGSQKHGSPNLAKIPPITVEKCDSLKLLNEVQNSSSTVIYETESYNTNPIYFGKPSNKLLKADYLNGEGTFLFSSTGNILSAQQKLLVDDVDAKLEAKRSLTLADLRMSPAFKYDKTGQGKNPSLGDLLLRKLGNMKDAAVYASQPHLPIPAASYKHTPSEASDDSCEAEEQKASWWKSNCSHVACDVRLLKNPLFWLVQAYCCVGLMGASGAGSYVPSLCQEKGLEKDDTALVLTTWGACNLVGRLVSGVVADRKWLRPSRISTLAFLVIGLLFQLVSVLPHSFPWLLAFGVLYGLFEGTYFTMLPLIIIDFVSLDNFSRTFGFAQLSQGAFATVVYPVLGSLRDFTGNYSATFHFLGACGLAASILLTVEPLIRALKWARPRDVISGETLRSLTDLKS